jgi:hypothetical protein
VGWSRPPMLNKQGRGQPPPLDRGQLCQARRSALQDEDYLQTHPVLGYRVIIYRHPLL